MQYFSCMPGINIREGENKVETLSSRYPRLGPATRFPWLILVGGPITDPLKVVSETRIAHVLRDIVALAIERGSDAQRAIRFMERPVTGPCRNG